MALYHMELYALPQLLQWFQEVYPKCSKGEPDVEISCIRFKKPEQIPFVLVNQPMRKVPPAEWTTMYTEVVKVACEKVKG